MSLVDLILLVVVRVLQLLQLVLILYMILSWLRAFNIINLRNQIMGQIYFLVESIVEPMLRPLRRVIPPLGGFDMAFLVLFLGIWFLIQILSGTVTSII